MCARATAIVIDQSSGMDAYLNSSLVYGFVLPESNRAARRKTNAYDLQRDGKT